MEVSKKEILKAIFTSNEWVQDHYYIHNEELGITIWNTNGLIFYRIYKLEKHKYTAGSNSTKFYFTSGYELFKFNILTKIKLYFFIRKIKNKINKIDKYKINIDKSFIRNQKINDILSK